MSPTTIFLGRFMGVGLILMCAALAARPKSAIATLKTMVDSPALLLVTGIITMAAGAAVVVGHQVWRGGAVAIAVTALGWVTLLKGLALVAVPPATIGRVWSALRYERVFQLAMLAGLGFGAWLTWASFRA